MSTTVQPKWKLVANLGDVNPIEHGGLFVFTDTTGVYPPEAELLVPPDDDGGKAWTTYRFLLARCTLTDGVLSDNKHHPLHCAWFATTPAKMLERPQDGKGLANVASFCGIPQDELERMLCSEDAIELATAYRAIGDYHGFENLDDYPLTLSKKEVKARYRQAKYKCS